MAKLLLQSRALVLSPELAAALIKICPKIDAPTGAIIVQQIHFWINKKCGRLFDGIHWIYNRYQDWMEQFPWLSEWKLRKVFSLLKGIGILKAEQKAIAKYDRQYFYTIDYEVLQKVLSSYCDITAVREVASAHTEVCTAHTPNTNSTTESTSKNLSNYVATEEKSFEEEEEVILDTQPSEEKEETLVANLTPSADNIPPPAPHQPTQEELGEVRRELRSLRVNPDECMGAIYRNWGNVQGAIAYLKEAISENRCDSPIAVFLSACKQGHSPRNVKEDVSAWFDWARRRRIVIGGALSQGLVYGLEGEIWKLSDVMQRHPMFVEVR